MMHEGRSASTGRTTVTPTPGAPIAGLKQPKIEGTKPWRCRSATPRLAHLIAPATWDTMEMVWFVLVCVAFSLSIDINTRI